MVVVVGRDSWMIVVVGSWMIDVSVVLYFGLTGCVSMWSQVLTQVHALSRSLSVESAGGCLCW